MAPTTFSVSAIRELFPALRQKVYGKQLIYFDNGATSQKPQVVLDTLQQYYALENANIHRGVHYLSQQATSAYEAARRTIQHYIGAKAPK
ncbi:MAG: aminotransferase class V-fold PLP-dependent enzyme, partial [Flavobacteriia bacterium]